MFCTFLTNVLIIIIIDKRIVFYIYFWQLINVNNIILVKPCYFSFIKIEFNNVYYFTVNRPVKRFVTNSM